MLSNLFSQGTFQKVIEPPFSILGQADMIQNKDSGFIITTEIRYRIDSVHLELIRLNKSGDIILSREFTLPLNFASPGGMTQNISATNDGGFVIASTSNSFSYSGGYHISHIFILKADSNMNIQWFRYFDPTSIFHNMNNTAGVSITKIFPQADGSYSMIGGLAVDSGYASPTNPFYLRIDSVGNIMSSKVYPVDQLLCCIVYTVPSCQNWDGNIITALGYSPPELCKLDNSGNIVLKRKLNGGLGVGVITQSFDSGFVACGNDYSGTGYAPMVLSFYDSDLEVEIALTATFNQAWASWATDICRTKDDAYVISGIKIIREDDGDLLWTPFLMKFNHNGIFWTKEYVQYKCFNTNVGGYSVTPTLDNGFMLYNYFYFDSAKGRSENAILKVDSLGNSGCVNIDLNVELGYMPSSDSPGINYSSPIANLIADTLFVPSEINATSFIVYELCPEPSDTNFHYSSYEKLTVFPNPVRDKLTIILPKDELNIISADIYNSLGQIVFTYEFSEVFHCQYCDHDRQRILNLENLSSGWYYLSLKTDRNIYTNKFIVIK